MRLTEARLSSGPVEHNVTRVIRGTGMWPFVSSRPWNLEVAAGEAVLIDPVAVASCAAAELRMAGWPGISLMGQNFQMGLIDQPEGVVTAAVEAWYNTNRYLVCDALLARLNAYKIDDLSRTAKAAMQEAIGAYRNQHYLSAVRVLLPEFECFARSLVADKTKKRSQKEVIDDLKDTVNQLPVTGSDPLESFSLHHFIDEHLFANCFTDADAQALGTIPNRHAEVHGFASFGDLKGATTLVCVMDFLLQLMDRLKKLTPAATATA